MLYRTYVPKEQVMKPDKDGMVRDHYTGEKIRYSEAEKGHLMYCQLPPLTLTSFAKKWGLVTIR